MTEYITVKGARQNNLKDINVKIPKHQITVFVGLSGSGKSSLVFDTIAALSRRELNATFPSFTRSICLNTASRKLKRSITYPWRSSFSKRGCFPMPAQR